MTRAALAMALALAATPAAADPLSDLLDGVFRPAPAASGLLCKKCTKVPRRDSRRIAQRAPLGASSWVASYYGGGERLNAFTASGEPFRAGGFTAAHRTLPLGTLLHVCFHGCANVRVNDRGPAAWTGRSLDLSRGAASAIGMVGAGVARVSVTILN